MEGEEGAAPPALAFAREVHETRAQLERVESLTDLTAEDATAQYVRQENKLARLQSRFDQRGLVLGPRRLHQHHHGHNRPDNPPPLTPRFNKHNTKCNPH